MRAQLAAHVGPSGGYVGPACASCGAYICWAMLTRLDPQDRKNGKIMGKPQNTVFSGAGQPNQVLLALAPHPFALAARCWPTKPSPAAKPRNVQLSPAFLLLLLASCHVFLPLAASNFSADALPLLQAGSVDIWGL